MQVYHAIHPAHAKGMDTAALREHFLLDTLFTEGEINLAYTLYDRMIVGGVVPTTHALALLNPEKLRASFFLERRELGIINAGGAGFVVADGLRYDLNTKDGLYLGKGTQEISFGSDSANNPAKFYLNSTPAHMAYPAAIIAHSSISPVALGTVDTANERSIYKYIHLEGVRSCQLVMGMTILNRGSIWNTMPTHVHDRRMEAYFYFDLPDNQRIFHFMGEPTETRHLVMKNLDVALSPAWSIHSGAGTSNYAFVWGMGGENQDYSDMDAVPMASIR